MGEVRGSRIVALKSATDSLYTAGNGKGIWGRGGEIHDLGSARPSRTSRYVYVIAALNGGNRAQSLVELTCGNAVIEDGLAVHVQVDGQLRELRGMPDRQACATHVHLRCLLQAERYSCYPLVKRHEWSDRVPPIARTVLASPCVGTASTPQLLE